MKIQFVLSLFVCAVACQVFVAPAAHAQAAVVGTFQTSAVGRGPSPRFYGNCGAPTAIQWTQEKADQICAPLQAVPVGSPDVATNDLGCGSRTCSSEVTSTFSCQQN